MRSSEAATAGGPADSTGFAEEVSITCGGSDSSAGASGTSDWRYTAALVRGLRSMIVLNGSHECSRCSDRTYQIGSRHGSQGDANDSSSEFTGSWWGCYLHSKPPPSSSGLRDPAAAIYTIPLPLFGGVPKYTARALGENEPLHGASFPGTYTALLPSSLLREAVTVLYASLTGHSHLCATPQPERGETL